MMFNSNMNLLHVGIGYKIEKWILEDKDQEETQDCLYCLGGSSRQLSLTLDNYYRLVSSPTGYEFDLEPNNLFTKEERDYIQSQDNGLEFLLGEKDE